MSPPEIWGPSTWLLFHLLADKVREDIYPHICKPLFNIILRICKHLPCPECANDATIFLSRIKLSDIKTKLEFKNIIYLFHNYVNAKKRKPLFNYKNLNVYSKFKLNIVIQSFINNYQTKGNMKLITESFQRQFVIKDLKNFIKKYIRAFIPILEIPKELNNNNTILTNNLNLEKNNDLNINLSELIQKDKEDKEDKEENCIRENEILQNFELNPEIIDIIFISEEQS